MVVRHHVVAAHSLVVAVERDLRHAHSAEEASCPGQSMKDDDWPLMYQFFARGETINGREGGGG